MVMVVMMIMMTMGMTGMMGMIILNLMDMMILSDIYIYNEHDAKWTQNMRNAYECILVAHILNQE